MKDMQGDEHSDELKEYSPPTCSVVLNLIEWESVLENVHRGALHFEAATRKSSSGLRALEDSIRKQLNSAMDDMMKTTGRETAKENA